MRPRWLVWSLVVFWLGWPLFAFGMGFALGGSVFWAVFGPNVTDEQARASYEQRLANPDPGENPKREGERWKGLPKPEEPWLAAFTAVLAVATIGLGIATVGLYRTGERQLDLIRRNAKLQDVNTRILQRAYISVQPGGIAERSLKGSHPNIVIHNAGNLPARHISWTINCVVDNERRRSQFDGAKPPEGDNTLPPKAEMMQGGGLIPVGEPVGPAPPLPLIICKQPGLFLYVWGEVFYEDGFGSSRITRFCHRYNCVNLDQMKRGHRIDKRFARFNRFGNEAT